jgi:Domain of unknown function (DUF4157)
MAQRRGNDEELTTPIARSTPAAPGKSTASARLSPRPIIFRVDSPDAARDLASSFGRRDGNGVAAGADAVVQRAAASSGHALPGDVRGRFEASLGADLSGVRVHTGGASADAAGAVGARAYTTGQDIHFGAGQYAPGDPFGLHLLAHEVAHTVQQAGGGAAHTQYKLEVSSPGDAAEVEADRAADAMVTGAPAVVGAGHGVSRVVQRDAAGGSGYEGAFGQKGGAAAGVEAAGAKAALTATGADGMLAMVTVPTDWAEARAKLMTDRAAELASTEFVGTTGKAGTDNPGYVTLIAEAGQYTTDVVRIGLAESVYNQLVEPANLGTLAIKQLRGAVTAMGFKDDLATGDAAAAQKDLKDVHGLGDGLKPAQKDELAKLMGNVDNVKDAQATVTSKEGKEEKTTLMAVDKEIALAQQSMSTAKGEVLTATKAIQSVVINKMIEKQTALAAASADEKSAILTEIAAISSAAKNLTKIVQVAGGLGTGLTGSIEDAAFDHAKSKVEGTIGDVPDLVGEVAGEIATAHYDTKLKELDAAIDGAGTSITALKALKVELSDAVNKETLASKSKTLATATQGWALLVEKRRNLLIVKSKAGDAKTSGGKTGAAGDPIAQLAVLVNDAKDARDTLQQGIDTATLVGPTVDEQSAKVSGHRGTEIPQIGPGPDPDSDKKSWSMVTQKVGPDQTLLAQMAQTVKGWIALARTQIGFADTVEQSISSAAPTKKK